MNPDSELTFEINGTIYLVSTHFCEADESVLEKIGRLIQTDVNRGEVEQI